MRLREKLEVFGIRIETECGYGSRGFRLLFPAPIGSEAA
jgi:hypothetical protein